MYVSNKHELSSRLTPTDQQNSTSSSIPITPAPSSTVSTSTASSSPPVAGSSRKSVPVAAIAAPVVIGVLAIASVVGLLFFLRRRKVTSKAAAAAPKEGQNPYLPPSYTPVRELGHGNVHEVETPAQEVVGDTVKYRHELETKPLETRPAELEGERAGAPK